MSIGGAL